jgi:hypothetical protein
LKNLNKININTDDNNLNDYLYCWEQFDSRPNKIVIHNYYPSNIFDQYSGNYNNTITEVIPTDSGIIINDKKLLKFNDDIFLSYIILDRNNSEISTINNLTIFYKNESNLDEINYLIEELDETVTQEDDSKYIFVPILESGVLSYDSIEINIQDKIELFYNKSTFKEIKSLSKNISGLNILYGEKGTGKTSIIDYLANKIDNDVIYINHNMIEHTINNPEFINYIKQFNNPLIIIDDCENILYDYYNKSNIITSNIIQMVDGLTPYDMILMFNTELDDIESNILELNNLNNQIKFEYLNEKESNLLSAFLGYEKTYINNNRVLDIIKNKPMKPIKNFGL